jgi:hypothetical protein
MRNTRSRSGTVACELKSVTRAVLAADPAEAAMRNYRWERQGLLGRPVRSPRLAAAAAAARDECATAGRADGELRKVS